MNQQDKKIHYLLEAINGLVKQQDRQRENFIQKPKEKSMNPNLPLFHGRINEDVSEWFFTLEQNFNACDIDDKRKVSLAHQYLRDSAAAEYRAINAFNLNYKQFKEAMVKKFQSPNYQTDLRLKLRYLRQTGTVTDYINKFTNIINHIEYMGEIDKAMSFTMNLQPNVQSHVRLKHPKNLNEAIEHAKDYESHVVQIQDHSVHQLNYSNIKNNKTVSHKKFNYQNNHNSKPTYSKNSQASYRPSYSNNSNKPQSNNRVKCFKCNKMGHLSTNCYSKTNSQNKPIITSQTSNSAKPKSAALMVTDINTVGVKLLQATVDVENNKIMGILDGGASISIISLQTAEKCQFKIHKTQDTLQTASGITHPIGKTDLLSVSVHGSNCTLVFLILGNPPFDLL